MPSKLLCRVKQDEKKYYAAMMTEAQPLLIKLKQCIEEDMDKLDIIKDEDFDNPSWALKQAYKQGVKKGLTKLLEYVIIGNE